MSKNIYFERLASEFIQYLNVDCCSLNIEKLGCLIQKFETVNTKTNKGVLNEKIYK